MLFLKKIVAKLVFPMQGIDLNQTFLNEETRVVLVESWKQEYFSHGDRILHGHSYYPKNKPAPGFILFIFGSADNYYKNLDFMQSIAQSTGKIALAFHYSYFTNKYNLYTPDQILSEVKSVIIAFRNTISCKYDDIIIFGLSLGGNLAIQVGADLHKYNMPVKIYSWSSFSRLSRVVPAFLGETRFASLVAFIISTLLCLALAIASVSHSVMIKFVLFDTLFAYVIASLYPQTIRKFGEIILDPLLTNLGWNLDVSRQAVELFNRGYLLFSSIKPTNYHKLAIDGAPVCRDQRIHDEIIPYFASLHKVAGIKQAKKNFIRQNPTLENIIKDTKCVPQDELLQSHMLHEGFHRTYPTQMVGRYTKQSLLFTFNIFSSEKWPTHNQGFVFSEKLKI